MNTFASIIIASLFVSAVALSGAVLFVRKRLLSEKVTAYLVSFAAGILLATAFFDLLPEAVRQLADGINITHVFLLTFLGIVSFFFLREIRIMVSSSRRAAWDKALCGTHSFRRCPA